VTRAGSSPGARDDGAQRIEGRVWAREGDRWLVGDALSRAVVLAPEGLAEDVREGDLVSLTLAHDGDPPRVTSFHRVFRSAASSIPGDGESARLVSGLAGRLIERAEITARVRRFFTERGFLEVETPALARCPGLDLHLTAFSAENTGVGPSPGYLITSPEYHMKRLVVGGIPRCFQLARCFRAGESGSRHEPEFTMLEWYRAWAGLGELLADTEGLVRAACTGTSVRSTTGDAIPLDRGFARCTVREAFARWAPEVGDPIALAEWDEEEYFRVLSERVEPMLGRERPTFLTHFAARHASLSRIDPEDPSVCLRAELYIDGLELGNGFVELTDPREQRARFDRDVAERAARGLPSYPIDEDFLRALEEGMPPTVGNAIGLDRLVAIALGTRDLREVLAFSHRAPRRAF
jgi:lysyl-tRNA synthetase class 2